MVVFCNYLSIMLHPIWGGWEGLLGRLCFPKFAEFLCVLCVNSLRSLRLKRMNNYELTIKNYELRTDTSRASASEVTIT